MKLTIGGQPISLFRDTTISLEKYHPALNENVGAFSYPFSVPTPPNQSIMGWPGSLVRSGDIPGKSFILEEQGIQVLRGDVEYDTVTKDEIGIILKSGITEFNAIVGSSKLGSLDWGSEPWFSDNPIRLVTFQAKLAGWDFANGQENAPFVVAPFQPVTDDQLFTGNYHDATGHLAQSLAYEGNISYYSYMLQFRAWYMIEKIFQGYGYNIFSDELKESVWKSLVIFTRPFKVNAVSLDPVLHPGSYPFNVMVYPQFDTLEYANLMPDCKILDFLDKMKALLGLAYDIDNLKKEVKIIQIKNSIASSGEIVELIELSGWQHKEGNSKASGGYAISYDSQDDNLDNRSDYVIGFTIATFAEMTEPTSADIVVRVSDVGRDYISVSDGDTFVWAQIGRLKPFVSGEGNIKVDFNVKVPASDYSSTMFKGPKINLPPSISENGMLINEMTDIFVSLYRGMVTNMANAEIPLQTVPVPFVSADKWISTESIYLTPDTMYNLVYSEYLDWKSSGARSFTKYVMLTLPQLLNLKWDSRYIIGGAKVMLSKVNYEFPFTGIVKVDGYTA